MTKVRVCVRCIPESLGRGLHRVARALEQYAPDWVQIVNEPSEADVWFIHCIGHGSMIEVPQYKGDIALIMYNLRTTEDGGHPDYWMPIWKRARVVWGYYDIRQHLLDRGIPETEHPNIYYSALGVDGNVFQPDEPQRKRFLIGTSGFIAETEGVRECHAVARRLNRDMFHLGPNLGLTPGVLYMLGIPDATVAEMWSQCSFVAGLRRAEGFELPAAEALACATRPIMFDAPHYRNWFGEHAEYVPEVGHDDLVEALTEVMSRRVRVVTPAERIEVLRKFNWQTIAEGFWEAMR